MLITFLPTRQNMEQQQQQQLTGLLLCESLYCLLNYLMHHLQVHEHWFFLCQPNNKYSNNNNNNNNELSCVAVWEFVLIGESHCYSYWCLHLLSILFCCMLIMFLLSIKELTNTALLCCDVRIWCEMLRLSREVEGSITGCLVIHW
jgi:hypothetical protein